MENIELENVARNVLRQLLRLLHFFILVFVIFGWLGPTPEIWACHLVFIPAMLMHWKTNQNRCILTEIEQKLMPLHERPSPDAVEGWFINNLFEAVTCGRGISVHMIKRIVDLVLALSWSITFARLVCYFLSSWAFV